MSIPETSTAVETAVTRFKELHAAGDRNFAYTAFVSGRHAVTVVAISPGLFLLSVYTADGRAVGCVTVLLDQAKSVDSPAPAVKSKRR